MFQLLLQSGLGHPEVRKQIAKQFDNQMKVCSRKVNAALLCQCFYQQQFPPKRSSSGVNPSVSEFPLDLAPQITEPCKDQSDPTQSGPSAATAAA